ncbi:MAG: 30S ribosomal protein S8 [Candidatus Kerfeldbacteria bacterium]|nr:30S ribosomal protein S8 [Candidatus Kerfeldbacteria bacterium]
MLFSTDPIADMLTRLRNAAEVRSRSASVPYSKAKLALAQVLVQAGWIANVITHGTPPRTMVVTLKYDDQGRSIIRSIRRVSRPGRRIYVGHLNLPIVANNFGLAVISTPQGMMTNREARRRKLGGEVICEVF